MTAREVIMDGNEGYKFIDVIDNLTEDDILDCMHEYAKLKCQELLLLVAKKARIDFRNNKANDFGIDVDSILNCVDLDSFIENKHIGTEMKLEYTTPIPKQYSFLEDKFVWDNENEVFQSKKRRLGAGTGDDSSLFIASASSGTLIWWRENRGFESTIFDGKELKTEEEFNQVFELLGIKEILKWT